MAFAKKSSSAFSAFLAAITRVGGSVALVVVAATHFVDPALGADTPANGTKVAPYKTLAYAAQQVQAPNTLIEVAKCDYVETASIKLALGVSVRGDFNMGSKITSGVATNLENNFFALVSTAEGTLGNQSISYLVLDGDNFQRNDAFYIQGRSGVVLHHLKGRNFEYSFVTFNGLKDLTFITGGAAIKATGNKLYACDIADCCSNSGPTNYQSTGALQIGSQKGFEYYDNTITSTAKDWCGYCVKFFRDGWNEATVGYRNKLIRKVGGDPYDFVIEDWNSLGGCLLFDNEFNGSVDINNPAIGAYTFAYKGYRNIFNAGINKGIQAPTAWELESTVSTIITSDCYFFKNTYIDVLRPLFLYNHVAGSIIEKVFHFNNKHINSGGVAPQYSGGASASVVRQIYFDLNRSFGTSGRPYPHSGIWALGLNIVPNSDTIKFRKNIMQGHQSGWLQIYRAASDTTSFCTNFEATGNYIFGTNAAVAYADNAANSQAGVPSANISGNTTLAAAPFISGYVHVLTAIALGLIDRTIPAEYNAAIASGVISVEDFAYV